MWPFRKLPRKFVAECAESIAREPERWFRHQPHSFYRMTRDDGLELVIHRGSAWFDSPVSPQLTVPERNLLFKATANWPGNVSLAELMKFSECSGS